MTEFENFIELLKREGYISEMSVVYRGLDDIIKLDCTGIIFYFKDGRFTGVENDRLKFIDNERYEDY